MADSFYPIVLAVLAEEDGGGFIGHVPDLPGCISDGETPEEALANTQNAVREWLDEAARLGQEMPVVGCAPERAKKRRKMMESIIEKQKSALSAAHENYERLSADINAIKEEFLEAAESQGPSWEIIPAHVIKSREPKLPH